MDDMPDDTTEQNAEDRPSDDTTEQNAEDRPSDDTTEVSEGGSADDTDGPSFDAMASAFTADDTTADEPADPLAVSDPTMLAIDQTLDAGLIQGSVDYNVLDNQALSGDADAGAEILVEQAEDGGADTGAPG